MIILVEDDADQRLALKLALEVAGYAVRPAANGRDALVLLDQEFPVFVITDLFMPEIEGFELIQAIRERAPNTKIIVVSGGGERVKGDYLASAAMMGVDATLQKPVEIPVLLHTLKTLKASPATGLA